MSDEPGPVRTLTTDWGGEVMNRPRQRIGGPVPGVAEGTSAPTGVAGAQPPTPRGRNLVPLLVAVTVIALFAAGV
ncbi:MAG TPA: hypothetical protein VFR22_18335, partial [Nocardioidaceae bacterium]|nr:hypothetical protein [Nocardioidaceae bacterium]